MTAPTYADGLQHGSEARRAGRPRVAALDPAVTLTAALGAVARLEIGQMTDYLRGWNHGWDKTNLEEQDDDQVRD